MRDLFTNGRSAIRLRNAKKAVIKPFAALLGIIMLAAVMAAGCEQEPSGSKGPNGPNFRSALRAEATPASTEDFVVLASYTDGQYNYFLLDGGYVQNTYLASMIMVPYNGQTPMTGTFTEIEENSVSNSITETVSNSYSNERSNEWGVSVGASMSFGAEAAFFKVSANIEFSYSHTWTQNWTEERSRETSFEEIKTIGRETSVSFTVGENNEPAGWYRYSLYGTSDVYFLATMSRDNQEVLGWDNMICVRSSSVLPYFEYSANGNFDNSPTEEKDMLPPAQLLRSLPVPENFSVESSGKISAGRAHSLLIDRDGNLWQAGWIYNQATWTYNNGANVTLPLVDGVNFTGEGKYSRVNAPVPSTGKFIAASAGGASGTVDKPNFVTPMFPLMPLGLKGSLDSSHSLAIDTNGTLWAWGSNYMGQLGDSTNGSKTTPVPIRQETKFTAVSAGAFHSLAIDNNGNLWDWGTYDNRQIANDLAWVLPSNFSFSNPVRARYSDSPVQINTDGVKFKEVSAGWSFSLALDTDGNIWSWGFNNQGELGDGTSGNSRYTPQRITEGIKFQSIAAGWFSCLAIDVDGNLYAWGGNGYGKLGTGDTSPKSVPTPIMAGTKFRSISMAAEHSLAVRSDGKLFSWGYNDDGQLGLGHISSSGTNSQFNTPQENNRDINFVGVAAGLNHSLAVDLSGNFYGWGWAQNAGVSSHTGQHVTTPTGITFE